MENKSQNISPSLENSNTKINKKKLKLKNIINPSYNNDDFVQKFNNCWRSDGQPLTSECPETKGLKVVNSPFNCAFVPNILQEEDMLNDVAKELEDINLQIKNNDLYKFRCSNDLKCVNKPNVQKLCKYIGGPLKKWVEKLSGLSLNEKVAISCSKYDYSDVLLCHDDELEGRRIAFIFYLVPKWKKKYGGSLDVFSVDECNRPYCIGERFYPKFNSFAFFEVSPVSFHQVSEILVEDKTRLSVNGWFHGDPIVYPPRPILKSSVYILPGEVEESVIYSWISPLYLDETTQIDIRKDFQEKSEIQLSDFLKKKKYDLLAQTLKSEDLKWKWVGPPNKRNLEVVSRTTVPDIVSEFLSLMQSEAMFLILSQLTGLELHHLAPQDDKSSSDSESESEPSTSKITNTTNSTGKGAGRASNERKKNKNENKALQNSAKKRKIDTDSDDEKPTRGTDCGVGGLLDGWESDLEAEHLISLRETQVRKEKTRAEVSTEVRRWRWGSYSLMRDDDLRCNNHFALDALMYFNGSSDWNVEFGGGTTYVAEGEEDELLTVGPLPNSLALVYRDKQTFKFTKHINVKSKQLEENSLFHEVCCVYREMSKRLSSFIILSIHNNNNISIQLGTSKIIK